MRIDGSEIELAGDQEDDGSDGGESGEPAARRLADWNNPSTASRKPLAGLRPGDNALEIIADHAEGHS